MSRRANLHGQDGQAMVLYGMTFLLVALITLFTVSVGVRVREKIKVQAAADAAAYSMAVAQARTMNTLAWANRAIVSEYVSGLSVVSHESYLNWWEGVFLAQSQAYYGPIGEYGLQCLGCPFGCACCCLACQSAKKANDIRNMWSQQHDKVHKIWHTKGKPLHTTLHLLDVGYIEAAKLLVTTGQADYALYLARASTQSANEKLGKAVDGRIEKAGPSPGSLLNTTDAVQVEQIDAADWDTYSEILAGTRTDWILRQETFVKGLPWLQGLQKQLQMAAQCGGTAISFTSAEGGAMTSKYSQAGQIVAVNQGNTHQYQGGAAKGEGGRFGLTSIDYGTTRTTMICRACEPVTYGQKSLSPEQDYRLESPKGCWKNAIATAYDGYSTGDSNSGAANIWTSANGVAQLSGTCDKQGISEGFFRYKLDKGDGNVQAGTLQQGLWNQPYAFASLRLDTSKDANGNTVDRPWDIKFGQIGGSVLTADASKNPLGGANKGGGESLSGKEYDSKVWPKVGGFGTALTYYHNPDHWAEVPNLWNPFWRAKLEDPTDSKGKGNGSAKKDPARHALLDLATSPDDAIVAGAMGYK